MCMVLTLHCGILYLVTAQGNDKNMSSFEKLSGIILSGGSRISRRGGVDLVRGAVDPRGGYVSKVLYVKMKESGPVGGGARAGRAPPRSANDSCLYVTTWDIRNTFM